uniref:Uncharacterized protein n=1 Tax=Romanomermis culicivorax TaxID=13658 RepID=A0A915IMU0_ROMCU
PKNALFKWNQITEEHQHFLHFAFVERCNTHFLRGAKSESKKATPYGSALYRAAKYDKPLRGTAQRCSRRNRFGHMPIIIAVFFNGRFQTFAYDVHIADEQVSHLKRSK